MAKKWIKIDGVVRRLRFEAYWDKALQAGALFPYVNLYGDRLRLTSDYVKDFTIQDKEVLNDTKHL